MKPTTISLTRTIQVRQYEPLSITVTGELEEGDNPAAIQHAMLEDIRRFLWEATGHARAEFAPPRVADELPFE